MSNPSKNHPTSSTGISTPPPVARVVGAGPNEQRQAHQRLLKGQRPLMQALAERSIPIIGRFTRVINGVHVRIERRLLDDRFLAEAGVVEVHPVMELTPDLEYTVPHIGAVEVAAQLGLTADGVSIGIIDSGIDYIHVALGGTGAKKAYSINDQTQIDDTHDGQLLFPNAVVAGGFDFVGAGYDGLSGPLPKPDPDPTPDAILESDGVDYPNHGTHVASTAAGIGGGEVAPGVAPGASLYGLKVFSDGSTTVTALAVEWAVDPDGDGDLSDRLDVLNMSVGSPFGGSGESHKTAEALAIEAFTAAGGITVCSAGNSKNIPFAVSSPGAIAETIAVANAYGPGERAPALEVLKPSSMAGVYIAREASSKLAPQLEDTGPVEGAIVYVSSGCADSDFPPEIVGQLALIERGGCKFVHKFENAAAAGATGVVVIQNKVGAPTVMQGTSDQPIPGVMIELAAGAAFKVAIADKTIIKATIGDDYPVLTLIDVIRSASSRGPGKSTHLATGGLVFKPNLSAPGAHVAAADAGTSDEATTKSGTSMAAPHVAGVAALLRKLHPDWSPMMIKAALMNTSRPEVWTSGGNPEHGGGGQPVPLTRQGAGRVDAIAAVTTEALAFASDEITLDLGLVAPSVETSWDATVTVVNTGDAPRTFALSHVFRGQHAGAAITLAVENLTVAAQSQAEVGVTLTIDAAQAAPWKMANWNPLADHQTDPDDLTDAEISGFIVLESADEPTLRVPFYALVRPTSGRSVGAVCLPPAPLDLEVKNDADVDGNTRVFTLAGQAAETGVSDDADLRAVGVRVLDRDGEMTTEFAIATWGLRPNAGRVQFTATLDFEDPELPDLVVAALPEHVVKNTSKRTGRVRAVVLSPDDIDGDGTRDLVLRFGAFDIVEMSWVLGDIFSSTLVMTATQIPAAPFRLRVAAYDTRLTYDGPHDALGPVNIDPTCGLWQASEDTATTELNPPTCNLKSADGGEKTPPGLLLLHTNPSGLAEAEIVTQPSLSPTSCTDALELIADDTCTAAVTRDALAQGDPCGGPLIFEGATPDTLPPGKHTISFAVRNAWDYGAVCHVPVTVQDDTPPEATCPGPATVEEADTPVRLVPTVSDSCGVTLADASLPMDEDALILTDLNDDQTSITWQVTARDPSGNETVLQCTTELIRNDIVIEPEPAPQPPDESCQAGTGRPGNPLPLLLLLLFFRPGARP